MKKHLRKVDSSGMPACQVLPPLCAQSISRAQLHNKTNQCFFVYYLLTRNSHLFLTSQLLLNSESIVFGECIVSKFSLLHPFVNAPFYFTMKHQKMNLFANLTHQ